MNMYSTCPDCNKRYHIGFTACPHCHPPDYVRLATIDRQIELLRRDREEVLRAIAEQEAACADT